MAKGARNVRMGVETEERLVEAASERGLAFNALARALLEHGLARLERGEIKIEPAVRRSAQVTTEEKTG